jgi:hypothetical protein
MMRPRVLTTEQLRSWIENSVGRPGRDEHRAAGAGTRTDAGEVLFSIDGELHAHLLMPVPAGTALVEDRRSEGVQVVRHELLEGDGRQLYVDLVCTKPHLERTFHLLAEEILEELRAGKRQPDQIAVAAIARWRELLDRPPRPPLGRERLAGLFGELLVLGELVALIPGALELWSGPRRQRHDFTGATCSIEVKTTMSIKRRIEVNGLDQLAPPDTGELYLRFFRVEEASGSSSVPDLVEKLADAGVARRELLTLLAAVDYDMAHENDYRRHGFRVVERRLYRVTRGFPCLTNLSFTGGAPPPGIDGVSYGVNLDFAGPYELKETEWPSVVRQLAGGS